MILHLTLMNAFNYLCVDLGVDTKICGVDMLEVCQEKMDILCDEYNVRDSEKFENYYKRNS